MKEIENYNQPTNSEENQKIAQSIIRPLLPPLTGARALEKQLEILRCDQNNRQFVVKVDNTILYALEQKETSWRLTRLYAVKEKGEYQYHPNSRCKKFRYTQTTNKAENKLKKLASTHNLFIIPNHIPLTSNGDNGIGADFVSEYTCAFCEIDDISLEEQWKRIQQFTLATGLIPSLIVYSGGKSLHIYFAFKTAITDKERWKNLQRKLILLFHSDAQIQNLNREMRLAGVMRAKTQKEQSVMYFSENRYTIEEIEKLIDSTGWFPEDLSDSRWHRASRDWYRTKNDTRSFIEKEQALKDILALPEAELYPKPTRPVNFPDFKLYNCSSNVIIPLEQCLSKTNQEALLNGAPEGQRNATGVALAQDLVGCANWLRIEGIQYSGDPEMLFLDFCARCSSGRGWNHREWHSIWRQISNTNPIPARNYHDLDGMEKFIHSFRFHNDLEYKEQCQQKVRDLWLEPDDEEYQKYVEQQKEEKEFERFEKTERFTKWLIKENQKGKNAIGFAKNPSPKTIYYNPENPFPTPDNYIGMDPPKIIYSPSQRREVWKALMKHGWEYIVDSSFMGLGKSHDAGMMAPPILSGQRYWYLDLNHRNPSTSTIERWKDLPPRHSGMVVIEGKYTPSGNPHLRQAKTKEDYDNLYLTGNCYNAKWFHVFKQKNYSTEGEANKICEKCSFNPICSFKRIDGGGFRSERKQALSSERVRACIDSLPDPMNYDYSKDVMIVEEISKSMRGTKTINAYLKDFQLQYQHLLEVLPEDAVVLKSFYQAICSLLEKDSPHKKRHGLDDADIRKLLPTPPDNVEEIINRIRLFDIKADDVIVKPENHTEGIDETEAKKQARDETWENIKNLPVNIFADLLEIWAFLKKGTMRVAKRCFNLTVEDFRHASILQSSKHVIGLTATPNVKMLARRMDISPSQIIQVQEKTPSLNNLTIYNTKMPGLKSRERSLSCLERIKSYKEEWRKQDRNVNFLGLKGEEDIDGYWFHDNIGSNQYKGKSNLVAFGSPFANIGAIQDEYQTLFQTHEGFEEYYEHVIREQEIQTIGRQRIHQYPEREFTIDFVNTDRDLSYFTETLGISVKKRQSFEFCQKSGTQKQYTRWVGFLFLKEFGRASAVKLKDIASSVGIAMSTASEYFKDLGGFRNFLEKAEDLMHKLKGNPNFFQNPDWRLVFELPVEEILYELIPCLQNMTWEGLSELVDPLTQLRFLGLIVGVIKPDLLDSDDGFYDTC